MSLNKDQICEIVNEVIYLVAIAPFLLFTSKQKWTQFIQYAYIGIILFNTMLLALFSMIFFLYNFGKMVAICKIKTKSKQKSTRTNRINTSNRPEGEFSNVGSFMPVKNTISETKISKYNYEKSGKHNAYIKKRVRENNHKLFADRR